ncbi:tRNA lysidine(34) synthetase TilS [Mycoplasma sp. 1654_15]|uniref:tRNA lysidine(34) synthetase TilS n=1 Tax=Mycoplasma sp. 1654_15 TaxID=2725994 RepID=UPI001449A45A|nr:tRNA lysidine(34) synthetase TilS [Mycoplasma sp. 1654_15]QJB71077.1 tRNA lysidine(34) synthetase TilS [Mycoplasma sp. 1654_15]
MLSKTKTKTSLLAVSGGPDSMFLLNQFKNKNIVVAHVNYHLRTDSDIDQQIVENYCQKYGIKLEILSVNKKQEEYHNIQNEAREIRYQFFNKIYQKYNCNQLLIAHQKDDFLETIFLQKMKQKKVNFWGIKKKKFLYNMNIKRPFLYKYFKQEVIDLLNKKQILFATDSSNNKEIYQRNKIRIELKNKSKIWKNSIILKYRIINLLKLIKLIRINYLLYRWKKTQFDIVFFEKIKKKSQFLYFFIHKYYFDINISSKKLKSIEDFLLAKERTGKYLLKNGKYLVKKQYKVIL